MASPGPKDDGASAAAAGVCCMCGDQGLPGELFQCGLCLQRRLQHRYCSNQYPRISAYPICNWCLRDKQQVGGGSSPAAAVKALATARAKQRAPTTSRLKNGSSRGHRDDKDRRPCGGGSGGDAGCSRSAFQAEPQKPVKKPKEIGAVQRLEATAAAKAAEVMRTAGGKPPPSFRAKPRVRRYRLLAEVIRCK